MHVGGGPGVDVVCGDFGLGCGVGQGGGCVLEFGVAVLGLVWYCVYLGTPHFGSRYEENVFLRIAWIDAESRELEENMHFHKINNIELIKVSKFNIFFQNPCRISCI